MNSPLAPDESSEAENDAEREHRRNYGDGHAQEKISKCSRLDGKLYCRYVRFRDMSLDYLRNGNCTALEWPTKFGHFEYRGFTFISLPFSLFLTF